MDTVRIARRGLNSVPRATARTHGARPGQAGAERQRGADQAEGRSMKSINAIAALANAYATLLATDRNLSNYQADELLKAINRLAKEIAPEPPKPRKEVA
jgi:hypothetical protein